MQPGLINSILVKSILLKNKINNLNIKLILLVRNEEEAKKIFGENNKEISYIVSDIINYIPQNLEIDYIIHGASPTKSKFFIEKPVETMNMSSMEMYGTLNSNNVDEQMQGFIDPLNSRSSYSQGKRTCELYSYSYFYEYGIPVKIARIAQTFGAGISKTESRVYKVFADAVLSQQDIVLKSAGTTIINFSYTTDTVIGILCILLNGKNGEAYNIVSDKTNMTILDSAKWLAEIYGNGKVRIEIPKENSGYAPNNNMILNNNKLKSIGWSFKYDLKHGYDRLLKYLRENN